MTMHEEWTDRLSDYLDGELSNEERDAVDAHLRNCADCTAVLDDLKRIVARARAVEPCPPQADLWAGIADRIEGHARPGAQIAPLVARPPRRIALTLPQLAAAAALIAAVSGGLAWQAAHRSAEASRYAAEASRYGATTGSASTAEREASAERPIAPDSSPTVEKVGLADAQYDAAVADLEKALKSGRGRLDASTIAVVEHNLQIIDQAIDQARQALITDPANSYLSSHLVEARRRKLDLLRHAAALTADMD